MKKLLITFGTIIIIFLSVILGIVIHMLNDNKIEKATMDQMNNFNLNNKNSILETANTDIKTTPNTVLVFETFFPKCGHSKITQKKIEKEDVNKTKTEIEKKYNEWKIKKYEENKIYFYKENNDENCGEHLELKEKDGFIWIYSIDENNREIEKKSTGVSTQYLTEDDKSLLREGIKVIGETEMLQRLSDYE